MHMKAQQKGFSAVEATVVILIVAILCAGGWFVWQSQQKKDTGSQTTSPTNTSDEDSNRTYENKDYGFSFSYPDNWKLTEELADIGRGKPEGTVSVTAPSGTVVYFEPNLGGKGGSCEPKASDRPDYTANCSTLRILSTKKTSGSSNDKPVYLTERKVTEPISLGSNVKYYLALTTIDQSLKVNTPIIDNDISVFQTVDLSKDGTVGYVDIYISSTKAADKGSRYGTSADYFATKEVTEGLPILESFRIQ